jgi:hypothetical protein
MIKNRINILAYIFVVSIASVIAFEFVILPWHFNLPRDIALMGFAGKPDTTIDDTLINAIGFTGDVLHQGKNPEAIRLLTLGGSAMFNRRMSERVKNSLNKVANSSVEVMGGALRTHTSMSSVIKYRTLSKYKFDSVLIYHGINDLFVNNVYVDYFKSDYSHMVPWYRRNYLLDNSLILRVIYNNVFWGRRIFGTASWHLKYIYPDKALENAMNFESERFFRRNLTTLVKEIKKDGAVPVLMTFAWTIPDHYTQDKFKAGKAGYASSNFKNYPVELWGSVEFVSEGVRRHNKVIREVAEEFNVLLLDQEKLLGKNLRWFEDICHLSEEGTDQFVQNITDFYLKNNLFIK